ncbi:MAG: type II toxin-antitoxin system HicB family antitoxin [Oscillospiraceae bacterium]|jgi:predicted RNase H-like HicB family nuclease|nr:type II toxin-antitoxin system HicB family antitoxin [Oscillospiraceae bacterium]
MYPTDYVYPALVYSDSDGISIDFPDLPGCCPCAHNIKAALENAREALAVHLIGMENDGDYIPAPSVPESICIPDGAALVMVDVYMPPIRSAASLQLAV